MALLPEYTGPKHLHHSYCPPNIVDTAVQHKQAWARLTNLRTKGEVTIVHAHAYSVRACNEACAIYHNCKTDGVSRRHSVAEMCPEPVEEETDGDS